MSRKFTKTEEKKMVNLRKRSSREIRQSMAEKGSSSGDNEDSHAAADHPFSDFDLQANNESLLPAPDPGKELILSENMAEMEQTAGNAENEQENGNPEKGEPEPEEIEIEDEDKEIADKISGTEGNEILEKAEDPKNFEIFEEEEEPESVGNADEKSGSEAGEDAEDPEDPEEFEIFDELEESGDIIIDEERNPEELPENENRSGTEKEERRILTRHISRKQTGRHTAGAGQESFALAAERSFSKDENKLQEKKAQGKKQPENDPADYRRSENNLQVRKRTEKNLSGSEKENSAASGHSRRRKKKDHTLEIGIVIILLLLILALLGLTMLLKDKKGTAVPAADAGSASSAEEVTAAEETSAEETTEEETTEPEEVIRFGVSFEKKSLTGMNRDEVAKTINDWIDSQNWNVTLQYGELQIPIAKVLCCSDTLLDEIFEDGSIFSSSTQRQNYTADRLFDEEAAVQAVAEAAAQIDVPAQDARVVGYDFDYGTLQFAQESSGLALNQEEALTELRRAAQEKDYDYVIPAVCEEVSPEITLDQAYSLYQLIGQFTTYTASANTGRDTNITVACASVSGTVVEKGAEFSIVGCIGDTTVERGYQSAAAFNNGAVIQEVGGGVCQVSTTLYNALVPCGLDLTERHNHSMAVHYVNLGEDAMISSYGSDMKFVNNSSGTILILMSYYNSAITALVYGIPLLPEGVTLKMESEVTSETPYSVVYVEDSSLPVGSYEVQNSGDNGYRVTTYLVTYQDGVEVSREWLHDSVYEVRDVVVLTNSG